MRNLKSICVLLGLALSLQLLTACGKTASVQVESVPAESASWMESAAPEQIPASTEQHPASVEEQPETYMAFPVELEPEKLVANSLFPSDAPNPDCGGEYGEGIATLELENTSDSFLKEASVTVSLTDGTELHFLATNIPAGKRVWAFSLENASISVEPHGAEINAETEFLDEAPLLPETVSYAVVGNEITITNLLSEDVEPLVIGCHDMFDGVYFGGITYTIQTDELEPEGSCAVTAEDCIFGEVEVVCVLRQ